MTIKEYNLPIKIRNLLKKNEGIILGYINGKFTTYEIKENIGFTNLELSSEKLTRRQKEILEIANKLGYFDYPRKISQIELANKLNTSASTVCEIMKKIISKIIKKVKIE